MFKFRLQSALNVKLLQEERLQQALADALREASMAEERLSRVVSALRYWEQRLVELRQGVMCLEKARATMAYAARLQRQLEEAKAALADREAEALEARDALLAAVKERKSLEALRDRAELAYLMEIARQELRDMDEVGTRLFLDVRSSVNR